MFSVNIPNVIHVDGDKHKLEGDGNYVFEPIVVHDKLCETIPRILIMQDGEIIQISKEQLKVIIHELDENFLVKEIFEGYYVIKD